MSDEQVEQAGGGKKKTVLFVAVMLVVEAVVLIGAFMVIGSKEPDVARAGIEELSPEELERERIVEIEVIDEKLPNAKRGVTYLYDTRIFVQVRNKHAERMNMELAQFSNEIKAEIAGIWRTSNPEVFSEPKLENLTRKLEVLFQERLGTAPDTGEPIVEKVVIVLGPGFRIDN